MPSGANDLTVQPSIELRVEYDDNLDFDEKDEIDDFAGRAIPGVSTRAGTRPGWQQMPSAISYSAICSRSCADDSDVMC